MSSGSASLPQFESLNGNQIRSIVRDINAKKMTVVEMAEHWGVEVDTIKRALKYRATVRAKQS